MFGTLDSQFNNRRQTTLETTTVADQIPAEPTAAIVAHSSSSNPLYTPSASTSPSDWQLYSREYAKTFRGKNLYRGFINSGFINGYINRVEGRVVWLQLSNVVDHCLPVIMPASLARAHKLRARQPITAQYTVRGLPMTIKGGGYKVVASLCYYGSIESAALPLHAAFAKTPKEGEDSDAYETDFKPYGSGVRLGGDPNRCFIAGIIAGKRVIKQTRLDVNDGYSYEADVYSEIVLRQDDDPSNRISVRMYRANHANLVNDVRVGDPVYVEAKLVIEWRDLLDVDGNIIIDPNTGKRARTHCTFLQTDAFRYATPQHILYLPDELRLPVWAKELRGRGGARRRVADAASAPASATAAVVARDETQTSISVEQWLALPVQQQYARVRQVVDADGEQVSPEQAVAQLSPEGTEAFVAVHRARSLPATAAA